MDDVAALKDLTDDQRAFALASEARWRFAHQVASQVPGMDVGDVYHALRCLELSPADRLKRGLARGRLRVYAR